MSRLNPDSGSHLPLSGINHVEGEVTRERQEKAGDQRKGGHKGTPTSGADVPMHKSFSVRGMEY